MYEEKFCFEVFLDNGYNFIQGNKNCNYESQKMTGQHISVEIDFEFLVGLVSTWDLNPTRPDPTSRQEPTRPDHPTRFQALHLIQIHQ